MKTQFLNKYDRHQNLKCPLLAGIVLFIFSIVIQGQLMTGWAEVDFNALSLTPAQQTVINQYENEWRQTYSQLYPQVKSDRQTLRKLINDPNANEGQVMMIQSRLQQNEDKLRSEATSIFMKKKKQLNPEQRQNLQKMMGR